VPAAAAGVVVGGGNGPVASGIGAVLLSIVVLSFGTVDGSVCAGALVGAGALALGADWLTEVGV